MDLPCNGPASNLQRLGAAIQTRSAAVGVCGMGYVGLPLAIAIWRSPLTLPYAVSRPGVGCQLQDTPVADLGGGARGSAAIFPANLKSPAFLKAGHVGGAQADRIRESALPQPRAFP